MKIAFLVCGDLRGFSDFFHQKSCEHYDLYFGIPESQLSLVDKNAVGSIPVGLVTTNDIEEIKYLSVLLKKIKTKLSGYDYLIKIPPNIFLNGDISELIDYLSKKPNHFEILKKFRVLGGPCQPFLDCFENIDISSLVTEDCPYKLLCKIIQKKKYNSLTINSSFLRRCFFILDKKNNPERDFRVKNWTNVESSSMKDANYCLRLPVRNTDADAEFNSFLSHTNIYISLSTSPKRISKLFYPLNTIDFTVVKNLILAVPQKYRGEESYDIPEYLNKDPRVIIFRDFEDHGSISKLLPALRLLKISDPNSIVITIDDDTVYPYGMAKEIAYDLFRKEKTVSCGCSQPVKFWKINPTDWPSKCDRVSEGWAGCGYKVSEISESLINEMELYAKKFETCRFSDDLVHSYVLAKNGFSVSEIKNIYHSRKLVKQLDYGYGDDAIYNGSGLPDFTDKITEGRNDGINIFKYRNCIKQMLKS